MCIHCRRWSASGTKRKRRAKAASNLRKHRVDFADAVGVFDDPLALSMPDEDGDQERFVATGCDFVGRVLVVAYTLRGDRTRLISARLATRAERKTYEEDSK